MRRDRSALADFIFGPVSLLHGGLLFSASQDRRPFEPKTEQQTTFVFFGAYRAAHSPRARLGYAGHIRKSAPLKSVALLRAPLARIRRYRQNRHPHALGLPLGTRELQKAHTLP